MSPAAVREVGEAEFEDEVLRRSSQVPVVVDFWAAWCAPCRTLTPILERLAADADGDWVLTKVDVDANPALAQAMGIQGIPAVRAFKDGKQIAEFTGALPEDHVRAWLRQLGPTPGDRSLAAAREAEDAGELATAQTHYSQALEKEPHSQEAQRGLTRVELRLRAGGQDRSGLEQRIAADASDLDALIALAELDIAGGHAEPGFARLLDAIERTAGDERDRLRRALLDLMNSLEPDDARVANARKRLTRLLY